MRGRWAGRPWRLWREGGSFSLRAPGPRPILPGRALRLAAALLLALGGCSLRSPHVVLPEPTPLNEYPLEVRRPVWRVGDWMEGVRLLSGRKFRRAVVGVEKRGYVVEQRDLQTRLSEGRRFYTLEFNPIAKMNARGEVEWSAKPAVPYFRWPLRLNGSWSGDYRWGGDGRTYRVKVRVDAYERVPTPAGTFKALRLELFPAERAVEPGRKGVLRYWYAPELGQVVRMEFEQQPEDSWVLTAYKRAPRSPAKSK